MEDSTTPATPASPVRLDFQLAGQHVRRCGVLLEAERLRVEPEGEAPVILDRNQAFDRLAFFSDQLVITGGAALTLKGAIEDVAAVKRWIGPPNWEQLALRQKKLAQPQLATGVILIVISLMGEPRWWTFNFGVTMALVGLLSRVVVTRWVFAAMSAAWGMMALVFAATVYLRALPMFFGVLGALFACFMVWLHYREFARFAGLPPRPRAS